MPQVHLEPQGTTACEPDTIITPEKLGVTEVSVSYDLRKLYAQPFAQLSLVFNMVMSFFAILKGHPGPFFLLYPKWHTLMGCACHRDTSLWDAYHCLAGK